jgi:hypothetical protein
VRASPERATGPALKRAARGAFAMSGLLPHTAHVESIALFER